MSINCKSKGIIVDYNNKVYPCCYVLTREMFPEEKSKYLSKLDNDWNDLSKYTLEKILSNKAFTEHFNEKHWNDKNNCDEICTSQCSIKKEENNA
tara:strand:- start:3015 stop:3299 length:285 start_codon:yes stop_codon:yes gene_type:complete